MNILVTGAAGQLGYEICRVLDKRGISNRGVDLRDFDITDADAVNRAITSFSPDAIIHCSAYTAVDRAEDEPELCTRVNRDGTANLALAARRVGAKMMYISTDYVFSGKGTAFYQPDDPTSPLSVYGKTKCMGEEAVQSILDRYFIVRLSWGFGPNGNNFVSTMLRLSKTMAEIPVVDDQVGSPTYMPDVAVLLCDMIVTDRYGIYHATNEGICTRAELAAEIMRLAGRTTVIRPIPTSAYPSRAARPLNSRLCKDKLEESGFSRLPHWKDALTRYLAQLGT